MTDRHQHQLVARFSGRGRVCTFFVSLRASLRLQKAEKLQSHHTGQEELQHDQSVTRSFDDHMLCAIGLAINASKTFAFYALYASPPPPLQATEQ